MKNHHILGNKVTAITIAELHQEIMSVILKGSKQLVLNTNVHGVNLAHNNSWLKEFRNRAGIVHCDGAGIMLGLRLLGIGIPCRITVHDWMWDLAGFCEKNKLTLYFLGAKPGITDRAAAKLKAKHPGLSIVGTHHGYFEKSGAESERIIGEINRLRPNILVVGFGMPIQEKWLLDYWEKIEANIFIAGGGVFDVLSGALHTCPRWMGDRGLEWFFRFLMEPRRLFTRYIIGNPLFLCRVLMEKFGLYRGRLSKSDEGTF